MAAKTLSDWIAEPLNPLPLTAMVSAAIALTIAFCFTEHHLAHKDWSFEMSVAWAVSAVLPFAVIFEWLKRCPPRWFEDKHLLIAVYLFSAAGALVISAVGTIEAQMAIANIHDAAPKLILHRAPLMLTALGMLVVVLHGRGSGRDGAQSGLDGSLIIAPVDSRAIVLPDGQWLADATAVRMVKAAGNYVELDRGGKVLLARATMHDVEARFSRFGFARVHRSVILNLRQVDRAIPSRGGATLYLRDGRKLFVRKRYLEPFGEFLK